MSHKNYFLLAADKDNNENIVQRRSRHHISSTLQLKSDTDADNGLNQIFDICRC